MSVNTTGFIGHNIENINPFAVGKFIECTLLNLFKEEATAVPHAVNHMGYIQLSTSSQLLMVYFKYHGKDRMMFVNLDCHSDYEDTFVGKKVIFSLGCNEEAKVILTKLIKVALAYSIFGNAHGFLCPNDSTDEFKEI